MAPRTYRMDQRAEAARATKRRIVEATLQLHGERGVLATSHKDVAERADVSVGTVYPHFRTRALVAFYAQMPWLEKLRTERHQVPALDEGLTAREETVRQLIRRAIGRGP